MNARLEHVNRAMHRAFLHEFNLLESGLPILSMIARVAPLLGALGTVFGLIAVMDSYSQMSNYGHQELLHSRALVPLAIGIVTGTMAYVMHLWLKRMTKDLRRDAKEASNVLVEALAAMEGSPFRLPSMKKHHHLPLLRLEPDRGNLLRLTIFQTCTILVLVFLMMGGAHPTSWQPPNIHTPALAAGVPIPNDESPSIWVREDGRVKVSRRNLTVDVSWEALPASIAGEDSQTWRLFLDERCPYKYYEDLSEILREAGVTNVVLMEQNLRGWL